ncbi:MAG: TNT domain-containing protein [Cyclobacteriaceae bacterium]|nr:TNT domain-containing protein [Cyclobacteriaceae bacterium]
MDGTGLQSTGSNMFSQYTPEMKALNAAYGLSKGYDETSAYLFYFAEKPEEENNLLGDMPLASQMGYIFSKNINDAAIHTMAHELGHGVFHLRHPFSGGNESLKGTTTNLMDYTGGQTLTKYQWDQIHQPRQVLFPWLQGEDEGALIYEPIAINFSSKAHEITALFEGKTDITYVTPAGRFLTLPLTFKPNFTGSFVKTKSKEQVMPAIPDGVLLSFIDNEDAYWGAHLTPKDGSYYFDGYRKRENGEYINVYYDEDKSASLGTSAKALLGYDPGCELELYVTTCNVVKESEQGNIGDGTVPNYLDLAELGTPFHTFAETEHNKSCLGELGQQFYSEQTENVADEQVLNKIFKVAKLIDKAGSQLYDDYKTLTENTNANYWDERIWTEGEQFDVFEKALAAYNDGQQKLEQLLVLYEDDRDKFTAIAWMLVQKYYQSIPVDTRHYILKKLSESAMYGNKFFGDGQEFLALRLLKTIPSIEEAKELVGLLKENNTLKNLYKNIDDEFGGDNFSSFIVILSAFALNDKNPTANADNIYVWDDSFLNRSDINYRWGFQEDGNLYVDIYKTEYQYTPTSTGVSYTPTKVLDKEKSLSNIDPFTWVPVRYRGESKYIPKLGAEKGNITFVPAIYLMALQTKHTTAVTEASIKTVVNVGSIFIGLSAIKAATTAVKVVIAIDAIASTVDVVVTWSENDIKKLNGGEGFLKGYAVFNAAIGLATFSTENIIKGSVRSTNNVSEFLIGWNSLCKNYSTNAETAKQLVNAIGIDNFKKIEANATVALDILKQNQVDVAEFAELSTYHAVILKNADAIDAVEDLLDWTSVLSKNIDELDVAPTGYILSSNNGQKYLKQIDALDLNTTRLTVKDGKIVKYADGITDKYFKSVEQFAGTFDKEKKLSNAIRTQAFDLYKEKNWEKLEKLFSKNNINGKWPPANGGYNVEQIYLKAGQKFDRYQYKILIDRDGNLDFTGGYISPMNESGQAFDYGSRALKGKENEYEIFYEITFKKDFDFPVEQADIIPWWGHPGNGKQIALPADKGIKWLIKEKYIEIKPIKSPRGNIEIS